MKDHPSSRSASASRAAALARRAAVLALACCALVGTLAGCSSTPVPVAKVDEAAVARYRTAGYSLPPEVAVETHRVVGPVTEAPWTIGLTRPADHQPHPLIVYLPSLGEDDTAPVRWIGTWARAGYAVLVIQALRDDADVWSTADARSGDFERIARARFADDLMADRIARLSRLLAQIRTRSLRGEAGLEGLDWDHLVLAGADLGGYTVQCIATSPPAALAAVGWPLAPRAFLVISPYATRSAAAATGPASAPVLMISARDDVDAYGVVTDPAIRHLAFDRLGGGTRTYFELGAATHRWLGGAVVLSAAPEGTPRPRPLGPPDEGPGAPASRRRRNGAGRDDMAPEGEGEESAADRKALVASHMEQIAARSRALTQSALSVASFEAVSVAFLDSWLRDRPAARAWLTDGAPRWLQDGDRIKHG